YPSRSGSCRIALPKSSIPDRDVFYVAHPTSSIETHSLPALTRSFPRRFTFYVADPVSSIETHSLPALTRSYPRRFTFYVADPLSSIHHFEQIRNFAHLLGFWQSFHGLIS